jgi:peptide/nickel transport system permease protein
VSRLARRALHGLFVLFGVSVLSFVLVELAPGDFFAEMRLDPRSRRRRCGPCARGTAWTVPCPSATLRWVASLARGELGYSFAYGTPVAPLLWPRLPQHAPAHGHGHRRWPGPWPFPSACGGRHARAAAVRRSLAVLMATLLAIPDILLALALLLLAVRTGWFPAGGMTSVGYEQMSRAARFRDVVSHLVLPAAALVLCVLPSLTRHVRASMAATLDAPFVPGGSRARPSGMARRLRHALPAAANPLVSLFGLSVATLTSMSLLVEIVMSWPGLGPLLLEAILARDFHLVLALVLASTVLLLAGNVLADVLLSPPIPASARRRGEDPGQAGPGRVRPGRRARARPGRGVPRAVRAGRAVARAALRAADRAALRRRRPGAFTCGRSCFPSSTTRGRPAATGKTGASRFPSTSSCGARPVSARAEAGASSAWTSPRACSCSARTGSAGTSSRACCTARASRSSRDCSRP